MSLCRSPTLPNQSRARADQGLGLLRTLAVYTGVILGGDDTEDEYHPLKVILVQHEGGAAGGQSGEAAAVRVNLMSEMHAH